MKNGIIVLMLFPVLCYSQTGFKWDITDTTTKSKSQIYSQIKMFIADEWKSAQNVIQNDDKEGGSIIVKGISKQFINSFYGSDYVYGYTVSFMFKDGKYRIIIKDVNCQNAYTGGIHYNPNCIDPFDGEKCAHAKDPGYMNPSCAKQKEMMGALKSELQKIVDDFLTQMKLDSSQRDW